MTLKNHLRNLVTDEQAKTSAARVGLWITVAMALITVGVDIALTLYSSTTHIPNTVYALEGTMFTAFAAWAGGPRIAKYIGPQIGNVATGIGGSNNAVADNIAKFIPHEWVTGDPNEGLL